MDPVIGYVVTAVVTAVVVAIGFGAAFFVRQQSLRAEDKRLTTWCGRLEHEQDMLADRQDKVAAAELEVAGARDEVARLVSEAHADRERVAGLTAEQARAEVIARAGEDAREATLAVARRVEEDARRDGEGRARSIMADAMTRMVVDVTTDSTLVTVPLPSQELKGRIIGREGRNIRAFEQITGANVLVDDTPDSVVLSCFDPVRRERARITLTDLLADGLIHPARIEQAYARSEHRLDEDNLRAAEDAVCALGVKGIDPGLLPAIGALRLRASYGQNVLAHSMECGRLAAAMAVELGADVDTSRRAAFLHDIGKTEPMRKAVTHAASGAELARRFGEPDEVVHAIAAHHNEVEPKTVEAVLVQVADAISSSRPGARRESVEAYVERLQRLEAIAADLPGVERVFAMQAGREVRIMVRPTAVDDAQATALAQSVARRIESELTYPGTIKVTVVRELRATALAK